MARNFKKIWSSGGSNPPSSGAEIAQNFNDNADAIKAEFDLKDMQIMNLSIINNKNDYTAATARAAVPTNFRKPGSIISYTTSTGVITEQYIGYDTTQWGNDGNWMPFADGRKLVQLEQELKYTNIFVDTKATVLDTNVLFIKEIYLYKDNFNPTHKYAITNIARNKNGLWFIRLTDLTTSENVVSHTDTFENNAIITLEGYGDIIVDWNKIIDGSQSSVNVVLTDKISNKDYSPSIIVSKTSTIVDANSAAIDKISEDVKVKLIADWTIDSQSGYVATNTFSGAIPSGLIIGSKIKIEKSSTFKHVKIPVHKGEVVYVKKIDYTRYVTANPIVVDIDNVLISIGDSIKASTFNKDGVEYWKFLVPSTGYLILSLNSTFKLYSEMYSIRGNSPDVLSEAEKQSYRNYLGLGNYRDLLPVQSTAIPFDYEVAIKMDKTLLISIVESASNGACTVLYDDNNYPSLMYKLPVMSIGMLSKELGSMDEAHPAFIVNGIVKRHIYAGVFINSNYNGVPVSWWGIPQMQSKSFLDSRNLCKAKGTGWHLETIWERSLISLLSIRNHNSEKPRGNNNRGRSGAVGYEHECIEGITDALPGNHANGARWRNGTQPIGWSHNNSRWGIFDIVGGYHEWCDLAKIDNGRLYLCNDNNYLSEESTWNDTGVIMTLENDNIVYSTAQITPCPSIKTTDWITATCKSQYDTINIDLRKKIALSLMCPRVASTDTAPLFNFDGNIWLRDNIICYPFIGGALEYVKSGMGFNIVSYDGNTSHNNMGSRLFYID